MTETMLAKDLSLHMPLDGMRMIRASAGTGKTFTIAGLYARLVAEEGVEVRNILVMTFTKPATEELRTRLRERLQLCARRLQAMLDGEGPAPGEDEDFEVQLVTALLQRALDKTDRATVRKRIDNAIQRMDEAAIFTIHSFCQRVLRDHAARIDAGGDDLDLEPSDRDLLEDIAADLWLVEAGSGDPHRLQALQNLASDAESLARILGELVFFDGSIEPDAGEATTAAEHVHLAAQALFEAWRDHGDAALDLFRDWFEGNRLLRKVYPADAFEPIAEAAHALASGNLPDDAALASLAWSRLDGAVKDAVRKKQGGFPKAAALVAVDTYCQARADLDAALLHELCNTARDRLDRRKRELQRRSYADLIATLRDAVTGEHAAALVQDLRDQYPYAMVDEFQDTNPAQYAILQALYDGFGSLLMIGDPKQAIYGFRGGDVHTYLKAAARVGDERIASLRRNFRSSSGMLKAIDALFKHRGDGVFVDEAIAFESVSCGREPEGELRIAGRVATPLSLWQSELEKAPELRAAFARGTACEIAGLLDPGHAELNGEPVVPGNIAVLVNKHDEAALVLHELQRLRIPAVSVQKTSIYATDEAREVLRLLDALLAPQSLRLVRGALATVLLGRSLSDLQGEDGSGVADDDLQQLAEWRRLWRRRGVLAMLEDVLEQHAARLLALDDGERRVANLMQLAEALQDAAHELAGPRVLRDALARQIREADEAGQAGEEDQLRLESDARRVQVMTLHASKGLEFDLVFLPFMGLRHTRQPNKGHVLRFQRDGKQIKRLLTAHKEGRNEEDKKAVTAAEDEQSAEDVRLLYVGITRAKRACWMGLSCAKAAKGKHVLEHVLAGAAGGAELCAVHPKEVRMEEVPATPRGEVVVDPPPVLGEARRFDRRNLQRDWWVHSFSQLNRGARDHQQDAPADHDAETDTDVAASEAVEVVSQPRGAEFGSAVHAVLEDAEFDAWRDATELPASQHGLLRAKLAEQGFVGAELKAAIEATARMLCASMNTPFIGTTRLVDIAPADRCAEMDFHFGMGGANPKAVLDLLQRYKYQADREAFGGLHGQLRGLMHGVIDLVCRVDGRWWVIDYKTNHLGDRWADYDAAGMQAAVDAAGYDLQYLIYALAVHRWLRQVLGDGYDAERDFGGVRYLFLRGMRAERPGLGVHENRPPIALLDELDELLAEPGRVAA